MTAAAKLALGTVQFGLSYGATNTGGRVAESEIARILDAAALAGIDMLDTAVAYGEAQAALGRAGAAKQFRIVTKTLPIRAGSLSREALEEIERRFHQSLELLGVPAVEGVLVHAAADMSGPAGLTFLDRLHDWKSRGLVQRIGVSIYDETDLAGLPRGWVPDLVQLPLNVLDQRWLRNGGMARLQAQGTAIHVRSAFLQGLLLTEPGSIPVRLSHLRPDLERWWRACDGAANALAAALSFATTAPGVERVVVGVHSAAHLAGIVQAVTLPAPALDWQSLAAVDPAAMDPRHWPKE